MVHGPQAGLASPAAASTDPALARHHRLAAVRAHLLERSVDLAAAREQYRLAASLTRSDAERRYLAERAGGLPPEAGAGLDGA